MSGLIAKVAMFFASRLAMLISARFRSGLSTLISLGFGPSCSGCRTTCGRRCATRIGRGTVGRDIAMTNLVPAGRVALSGMAAGMFIAMLAKRHPGLQKKRNREAQQQHRRRSRKFVHNSIGTTYVNSTGLKWKRGLMFHRDGAGRD
jgi:hypothetical protein